MIDEARNNPKGKRDLIKYISKNLIEKKTIQENLFTMKVQNPALKQGGEKFYVLKEDFLANNILK